MNPNLETIIITSVISSGVISSVIGVFQSIYLQRKIHSQDNKTIVIQKRVNTYDALEEFLGFFNSHSYDHNDDASHTVFFNGQYTRMIEQMKRAWNGKIWMNPNTEAKFTEIYKLINPLETDYHTSPDVFNDFAVQNYSRLNGLRDELYTLFKLDYPNLHNLTEFRIKVKEQDLINEVRDYLTETLGRVF